MIVAIEGVLEKATPLSAIINVGGLSYSVSVPVTTASRLPKIGERVQLHTHVVYREDSQTLHGFTTEEERDFFILIIEKVSGVGPKVAQSILSKLSLEALSGAISSGNATLLAKTPGIGKKTAERIIVELRDKLGALAGKGVSTQKGMASPSGSAGTENTESDAILALTALGYKQAEAKRSVEKAIAELGPQATTEEIIRTALS